jgi:hypothetical protein
MNESAVKELKRLLGEGNVKTQAAALKPYFAGADPGGDLVLVTPEDTNGLADIAHLCSENGISLFSVKRRHHDGTLLGKKGVLVDLVKMDQIKRIDAQNLTAFIYGGVTFEQLSRELARENQKVLVPVAGTSPCVLRSYMDRDVLLGEGGYRHPNISVFHAMMASGEIWVSGSQQMTDEGHADFREDQGPQFSPFFGASEDIYGIPYYGLVYTYPVREVRRLVAFSFDELGPAADLLYRVSRAEWCFESFAANSAYLSVILAGGRAADVEKVKKDLAPWTAVFTMEHYRDLVDLWERYITEAAIEAGGKQLSGKVPQMCEAALQKPWYVYDRDFYRGRCETVDCYQYFRNVEGTFALVDEQAASAGVSPDELGKIVVPVYFGANAYCEADLYYDPRDEKAAQSAGSARLKSYEALLEARAFIDRPTGKVAQMLYGRTDPSYVNMLKLFKRTVDPKGILNPGQLLEGV